VLVSRRLESAYRSWKAHQHAPAKGWRVRARRWRERRGMHIKPSASKWMTLGFLN
jgi:hypothetical protein